MSMSPLVRMAWCRTAQCTGARKVVLMALVLMADRHGEVRASAATISRSAGYTGKVPKATREALRDLEAQGFISRTGTPGGAWKIRLTPTAEWASNPNLADGLPDPQPPTNGTPLPTVTPSPLVGEREVPTVGQTPLPTVPPKEEEKEEEKGDLSVDETSTASEPTEAEKQAQQVWDYIRPMIAETWGRKQPATPPHNRKLTANINRHGFDTVMDVVRYIWHHPDAEWWRMKGHHCSHVMWTKKNMATLIGQMRSAGQHTQASDQPQSLADVMLSHPNFAKPNRYRPPNNATTRHADRWYFSNNHADHVACFQALCRVASWPQWLDADDFTRRRIEKALREELGNRRAAA